MLISTTSRAFEDAAIWNHRDVNMKFAGYRRKNGAVGTRNYIGLISTVVCANEVADSITRTEHDSNKELIGQHQPPGPRDSVFYAPTRLLSNAGGH